MEYRKCLHLSNIHAVFTLVCLQLSRCDALWVLKAVIILFRKLWCRLCSLKIICVLFQYHIGAKKLNINFYDKSAFVFSFRDATMCSMVSKSVCRSWTLTHFVTLLYFIDILYSSAQFGLVLWVMSYCIIYFTLLAEFLVVLSDPSERRVVAVYFCMFGQVNQPIVLSGSVSLLFMDYWTMDNGLLLMDNIRSSSNCADWTN